jgi:hypothetical protein
MKPDPGKLMAAMIGVGLCVVALTAWRLPTAGSPPGLDLRLIVTPPGELTVAPDGVVASVRAMQAGDAPAEGSVEVGNITGRTLLVRPVALSSVSGPRRAVQLRAVACGETIASGTPASLERPRGAGFRLAPRESCRVEVSTWIEPDMTGYRGRILDISLEFRTRAIEARR